MGPQEKLAAGLLVFDVIAVVAALSYVFARERHPLLSDAFWASLGVATVLGVCLAVDLLCAAV